MTTLEKLVIEIFQYGKAERELGAALLGSTIKDQDSHAQRLNKVSETHLDTIKGLLLKLVEGQDANRG